LQAIPVRPVKAGEVMVVTTFLVTVSMTDTEFVPVLSVYIVLLAGFRLIWSGFEFTGRAMVLIKVSVAVSMTLTVLLLKLAV
jgi:hypothetical protein